MAAVVIWLVVAGALAVGEVLTLTLVLGMFAGGAAAAAAVAFVGGGTGAQVGACIGTAVVLAAGLRPIARRHLRQPPSLRTGTDALIGARGTVVEPVDGDGGRIRIRGEIWSARTYPEHQVLRPGTAVRVLEIDGATAVVHRSES